MNADAGKQPPESSPPQQDTAELRENLRRKWELASVLNFLHVFEPVMKTKLKLSAEDIETGLIEFSDSLGQLHIVLLKGITSSKFLDGSQAWVITLSRVLQSWWPWVAEGDFPLKTSKGGEVSRYKELDPTVRLLILKAICEVRAIQDDIVSFVNETTKDDTAISTFRKEKLADENGTAYWYDGDEIIGHRLYREVHQLDNKMKFRGKEAVSDIYSQWETVATNLEEFRLVKDELESSDLRSEVSVTKTIEVEVIPALEKLQKKKERALKQLEKKNALPCVFQSSRSTRSSRNSKPISYTYDAYDKAIKEAIQVTENRKIGEKPRSGKQNTVLTEGAHEVLDSPRGSSTENDSDTDGNLGDNDVEDGSDDEYENENENENEEDLRDEDIDDVSDSDEQTNLSRRGQTGCSIHIPRGSRFSSRLARTAGHGAPENININAKNRLRQRPSVNTAFECSVPDSEEENVSNSSKYFVLDSEEEYSGNSNSSSKRIRT